MHEAALGLSGLMWPHLLRGSLPEAVQQDVQVGLQVLVVAVMERATLLQAFLGREAEVTLNEATYSVQTPIKNIIPLIN